MTEVRAINRNHLAAGQCAHILPNDLGVAKRRPTVRGGLGTELGERAAARRNEERLASDGVVKCNFGRGTGMRSVTNAVEKRCGRPVAESLGAVTVETRDPIGDSGIDSPSQRCLHATRAAAVRFGAVSAFEKRQRWRKSGDERSGWQGRA